MAEIKTTGASSPRDTRRSDRVQISLCIDAIGIDYQRGKPFCQKGRTVTVSQHGAAIALSCALATDQELTIRCTDTGLEAAARVVGLIDATGDTSTYGLAFLNAQMNPWGIEFPESGIDEGLGRMLLACHLCRASRVIHFNEIELQVFEANQSIQQFCKPCSATTYWKLLENPAHSEPSPAFAKSEKTATQRRTEKRKYRRVGVNSPACIRHLGTIDEVVTCDVSRSGLCVRTSKGYREGALIEVAFPYSPGESGNIFVPARVVHAQASGRFSKLGIAYAGASGRHRASVYSSGPRSIAEIADN